MSSPKVLDHSGAKALSLRFEFCRRTSDTPEIILQLHSEYIHALTGLAGQCKGLLRRFNGDAAVFTWNGATPAYNHATLASTAALSLVEAISGIGVNYDRVLKVVHAGVACRPTLAGNMGCETKVGFCELGGVSELAQALCGLNRKLGTAVLACDGVQREVAHSVTVQWVELMELSLATRPTLVDVYELKRLARSQKSPPDAQNEEWMYAIAAVAAVDPYRDHNAAALQYRDAQFEPCATKLRQVLSRHGTCPSSSSAPVGSTCITSSPRPSSLSEQELRHTRRLLQRVEALVRPHSGGSSVSGEGAAVPRLVLSWRLEPEVAGQQRDGTERDSYLVTEILEEASVHEKPSFPRSASGSGGHR
eukprot:RCo018991